MEVYMSKPKVDYEPVCPDCGAATKIGSGFVRKCVSCPWDAERADRIKADEIRRKEWEALPLEERKRRIASGMKLLPFMVAAAVMCDGEVR
jgi:hypothetical protein